MKLSLLDADDGGALTAADRAERAGIEKRVTAHTLRHTAATWLRQQTGDARLVAEFLGHADLSTIARYAHVAPAELHAAAAALSRTAVPLVLTGPTGAGLSIRLAVRLGARYTSHRR